MILFGRNKTDSERTKNEGYRHQVRRGDNYGYRRFKNSKICFLQAMCFERGKGVLGNMNDSNIAFFVVRLFVRVLSHVPLFATPWTVACSSVHGILSARILKWVAISSSRGSSQPGDWTRISCVSYFGRWILYHYATWETPNIAWAFYFIMYAPIYIIYPYLLPKIM